MQIRAINPSPPHTHTHARVHLFSFQGVETFPAMTSLKTNEPETIPLHLQPMRVCNTEMIWRLWQCWDFSSKPGKGRMVAKTCPLVSSPDHSSRRHHHGALRNTLTLTLTHSPLMKPVKYLGSMMKVMSFTICKA